MAGLALAVELVVERCCWPLWVPVLGLLVIMMFLTVGGGGCVLMVVVAEVPLPWRWSHMYINTGAPGKKETFC